MTNLQSFKEEANLNLIGETTVWDFHNVVIDNVAMKKGTNLNKLLCGLKKSVAGKSSNGMVTIYVYQIGRSQHSASKVAVFDGIVQLGDISTSLYYSKRLGEVNLKMDCFND